MINYTKNGNSITYHSNCDYDCLPEHRLFNGRDCPRRKKCAFENGHLEELSRDDINTITANEAELFDSTIDMVDAALAKFSSDYANHSIRRKKEKTI